MSALRRIWMVLAVGALLGASVLAQEKPAAPAPEGTDSFESLKTEYQGARRAWWTEYQTSLNEAQKNGKGKDFKFDKPSPDGLFSQRFLAIAEKNPDDPAAIDALIWVLNISRAATPSVPDDTRAKAIKFIKERYAATPRINRLLNLLTQQDDDNCRALVADVIARNPDRKIQFAACNARMVHCESLVKYAEEMKDPKSLEGAEKGDGKEATKARLATAELAKSELEGLKKTLRDKYGDLLTGAFFVVPYDAMLALTPVGGSAGAVTEFGLGTSEAKVRPVFTGLPHNPQPNGEVKIGFVAAGSELHFYEKSEWGGTCWAFSHDTKSEAARVAFFDRDNSLGLVGSAVEKTGPTTWLLHLDDAASFRLDSDNDEDVLIQIRLVPAKPRARP